MVTTTTDRCKKCFVLYTSRAGTFAKSQACECADPHIDHVLTMSPGIFDFIFTNWLPRAGKGGEHD
jgi:hypothetical protein